MEPIPNVYLDVAGESVSSPVALWDCFPLLSLVITKLRKTLGQKSSHNSIQHRPSSKRSIAVLFEDRAEQRLRMCRDRRGLGTKQRSFAKGFSKQRHILAFLRWQTMMSRTCAVHYSALPYSRSTQVSAPRI